MNVRWLVLVGLLVGCRTPINTKAKIRHDPTPQWDAVLAEVVTHDGYVDYDRLEEKRDVLDQFVAFLRTNRGNPSVINTHHAFWLNAHNALVLHQVLYRDRPESVLDVDGWFPIEGSGFFMETSYEVRGEWLSMWDIQHERLRQRNLDIRDHSAMNLAAVSSPPFRNEVYKVNRMSNQLRDQMKAWVNDEVRGVRIENGEALFNDLFEQYSNDFSFWEVGDDLCSVTGRYAEPTLQAELSRLSQEGCPHRFMEFDWRLNDVSNRP
ncbi:MAG: DUF547 domain-containing protein [Proteobacteria bacterium]|jgi:hypothetical protein|nr:DUF547 domain-containing protein [Pseudomonadota bacterium]